MTATPTKSFNDFLLTDDVVNIAPLSDQPFDIAERSTRQKPVEGIVMATVATIVICILALTIGWQIALFLGAALAVKTVNTFRNH